MTDNQQTTDPQELAQKFLDLWQKQISHVMQDNDAGQQWLTMFQSMQQQFLANTGTYAPPSPIQPDDVPQHSSNDSVELKRRIAECEERITTLEKELKARS